MVIASGEDRERELERKLARLRGAMGERGLDAIVLRGVDWFSWVTCGGSSVVILGAEVGVAEVVVTSGDLCVVTDEIEARRLTSEELPRGVRVAAARWSAGAAGRAALVEEIAGRGRRASDRPADGEAQLPEAIVEARATLDPVEVARYRALGGDAARAATAALIASGPTTTGWELAGRAARALWARGIHPMLTLVGDAARLPEHRHPTASGGPLGDHAMLVICGRRHGLYANLTRFIYFRPPRDHERARHEAVAEVERAALAASRPGATLGEVYEAIVDAYARAGFAGAEREHHQGGPCGYLSRDALAVPGSRARVARRGALAWNPSVVGAKIEDTVIADDDGVHVLTVDPVWPVRRVGERMRPDVWVV